MLRRGLRTVRGKRSLRRRDSRYRRQPAREGAPLPGAIPAAGCGSAATAISPDGRRWSDARDSREGSHARQPRAPGHQPISSRRQSCRHRGLTGFEGHAYNADVLSVYPRRLRLSETGNCGLDLPFSQRGSEGVARALACHLRRGRRMSQGRGRESAAWSRRRYGFDCAVPPLGADVPFPVLVPSEGRKRVQGARAVLWAVPLRSSASVIGNPEEMLTA